MVRVTLGLLPALYYLVHEARPENTSSDMCEQWAAASLLAVYIFCRIFETSGPEPHTGYMYMAASRPPVLIYDTHQFLSGPPATTVHLWATGCENDWASTPF